ncbi:MAG: hypothetical protein GWO20_05405 [Candidatus Korarchaeota archaeon]|nr:hypothetical protein [Candidatus Korarchaeota archaeon]NIU82653.1 hypothetical protein [Candidatus Thorarchaeota archaeon]NIW13134.1 hypothetical protein [Candidatus Thorarchaeota archaeon]NIW51293.1 hypothetical protein [Candidatus Korarchaeota archaeon]
MEKKVSLLIGILTAVASILLSLLLWFVFHLPFFIFVFFLPCVLPFIGSPLERERPPRCPNCNFSLKGSENYCPRCGYKLREDTRATA